MILEQRPEMARDASAISELDAKNRFVKEKFEIPSKPKAKAAEKAQPAPRARPPPQRLLPPRAKAARP